MMMVRLGNERMCKLLLARDDIDVNIKCSKGITALIIAVFYERKFICELLLERGADLNAAYENLRVLQISEIIGNIEVIKLLETFYKFNYEGVR